MDASTGRPFAGVAVEVAGHDGREPRTVMTDKHGFFVVFGLDPDRYITTVRVGSVVTRHIEDVASGQMRHLQIVIGADSECNAGRPAGSLVDPDETADVYRIR